MRHKSEELMQQILNYAEKFLLLNHRSPYTSEIADALGIVKSTVYRYLVEMNERETFQMSIISALLGREVSNSPESLYKDILKAEYLLPIYIDELLQAGKVSVKVLDTNDKWFGVTYEFKEELSNVLFDSKRS